MDKPTKDKKKDKKKKKAIKRTAKATTKKTQPKPDLFKYLDRFNNVSISGSGTYKPTSLNDLTFLRNIYGNNPNIFLEQQKQLSNIRSQNVEENTQQRAIFEKQLEQVKKEGLRYKNLTGEENEITKKKINELNNQLQIANKTIEENYNKYSDEISNVNYNLNNFARRSLYFLQNLNNKYTQPTDFGFVEEVDPEELAKIEFEGQEEAQAEAEDKVNRGEINREALGDETELMIDAENRMKKGRGRPKLSEDIRRATDEMKEFIKSKKGRPTKGKQEAKEISKSIINDILDIMP